MQSLSSSVKSESSSLGMVPISVKDCMLLTSLLLSRMEEVAYTSEGNHMLTIFKEPENYDSLRQALSDIRREVEEFTAIKVCGIPHSSKFSWHNIFVILMIDPSFTKIFFTNINTLHAHATLYYVFMNSLHMCNYDVIAY